MDERPRITQEMVRLYDEYTHLTLDRRGFMDRLAKAAGGTAAAAAIAPLLGASPAAAAMVAADDPRLKTERVEIDGPVGALAGYLARPAATPVDRGAVLVVHENRGLNPYVEDVTRRLAVEGFLALGLDFLSPLGGTPADEDAARAMFRQLDPAGVVADGRAALAWLAAYAGGNGRTGAVGFCWGGGVVNRLAVAEPRLAAAVAFYGEQPPSDQVGAIRARLMLHYAALDERINAGIPAYVVALKRADVDYQVFVYEGVNHAFHNDTSAARYDPDAAQLAWSRTVAFLRETLA
jgi:carboxymethylenebutenolidase